MDKKLGVYICSGCGIGESLDIEKLCQVAVNKYHIENIKVNAFFCGEEGAKIIKDDIEGGVNTIILGACSPRVNYDVFNYGASNVLERVNLREHVVWTHSAGDEDTQMLAEDYLRMGIARALKVIPPDPYHEEVERQVLVVGGGVSGMTAALESAEAGYKVYLIEKEDKLGGWMSKLYKQFPKNSPYRDLEDTGVEDIIGKVKENGHIKIYLDSEIESISGGPGKFEALIKNKEERTTLKIGSIVQATGFKPYPAEKLDYLGWGKYPDVITNLQMEELGKGGVIKRPSDGKEVQSVVFVQCAGQRDEKHLAYCSSICCLTSLKQALYVRGSNPGSRVYIVYKDMRTPGQYEDFYRRVQEDGSVTFAKGEISNISEANGGLKIVFNDLLLGEEVSVDADLVVLAAGMVPTSMPEAGKEIGKAGAAADGKDQVAPCLPDSGQYATEALHLKYRQGPELPTLKYGFPDSHFICFPYETRRTGIFAAGCLRQPMDITGCKQDATGAALKAIQCIELTTRGEALHPRVGDRSYPELFMQRCTQCKRCTEECPFGMYNEDEKYNPLPNPTRCRRCGICMGSCPERIISFKDYSIDIISSMLKAIEVPDPEEEKPRIIAFLCENDAYPALDTAGMKRLTYNPYIRVIPVRCLGSVNIVWIADSLSKGIDGVLMIGCKYGDDYQCHYIKGSELANYRMGKVQETLERLVLESERIQVHQLSISEYDKLPIIFDDFLEKIQEIGPNPYKGM
jgi:quinone-modifying oxidoreductase subunit QmoB